ncbi:MAG: hypothetical protein HeimC3_17970 [Candidatus Heimdallarchaeota archaeon LC_3]|nr:MAG: hypothetical protein HeimC3_17970 [Candidatus Heimdallarchaeota archaeon LC_3]
MTERKREKIHILTFHRTIELYLICFLNGNSIERISLEKYLIREKEGKRIAFKDVYLPLIEQLNLPIVEESNENRSRGRYNPIIWKLSLEDLLNDYVNDYLEYLKVNSLKTIVNKVEIKNTLKNLLLNYQEYWKEEINYVMTRKTNFSSRLTALIAQLAIIASKKINLIKFLPIYLILSIKIGKIQGITSKEHLNLEREWISSISTVPSFLEMLNYYQEMLFDEWSTLWPFEAEDKENFLDTIKNESKSEIFKDKIDLLFSTFKNKIDNGDEFCYLFSPSSVRDEGYWTLFYAIKESKLCELNSFEDHKLSKYVLELKNSNEEEFNIRNNLFLKFIYQTMINFFNPDLNLEDIQNFFVFSEDSNKSQKFLFGVLK